MKVTFGFDSQQRVLVSKNMVYDGQCLIHFVNVYLLLYFTFQKHDLSLFLNLSFSGYFCSLSLHFLHQGMMSKSSPFAAAAFVLVDACVVQSIRSAPLSPLLVAHPYVTLWGGGILRACALLFLSLSWGTSWISSFQGRQTIGVLCFHFPVYVSLLWGGGWSNAEELWSWFSWQRVRAFLYL